MPPAPRTRPIFIVPRGYLGGRAFDCRFTRCLSPRMTRETRQRPIGRPSTTLDLTLSAAVAELVDARRSGRRVPWDVEVRLLSAALSTASVTRWEPRARYAAGVTPGR